MKTILHTIDTTGPGGAETVFIDLASRLDRERYRPVVVIKGRGWVYDELHRRGIEPLLVDASGSVNLRYLWQLARIVRRHKVDLIQAHLLGSSVYGALAGMLTATPVVATFHGAVDISPDERLVGVKFGAINRGAGRIVAVSESLRRDIAERTPLDAAKTTVIYNAVEAQHYARARSSRLRQAFGWSETDLIVGCLGNVRPAKGYDLLLQAAAGLRAAPLRFVIAGQGKPGLYDRLLAQRARLGLEDRVQFLGFVADAPEFLSNLDMFLLPSTSEGFSISTIEAMAAGLPVLATRCGGPEEILTHGETGLLVEKGSSRALVEGLQTLITDSRLRDRLARKGKAHAATTFGMPAMLQAYEHIYEQLIGRGP